MISFISGKIKHKNEKFIILETNGVGYQVFISSFTFKKIGDKKEIDLFTFLYVGENILELYGFLSMDELNFFKKLLTISGVGPRSALNIMSVAKIEDIKKAIIHGDPLLLTQVSGIGKKTAERIIVELKTKISIEEKVGGKINIENIGDNQAIDALVNLGYRRAEAQGALEKVDSQITNVEERVKEALKVLGKK